MHSTIGGQTFTYYKTRAAAESLAAVNQAADPDTEYKVEEAERGFFVALYDAGERVGTL